jgi:hypothetical protein
VSLPRENLVVKMNHDDLERLRDFCELRGFGLGEFVEGLVVRELKWRFHEATVLAAKEAARKRPVNGGENKLTVKDGE